MLDRINSNNLDKINQGQTLEKISTVEESNSSIKTDYKNYLVDESQISESAFAKYQKELDIERFGDIVKSMSQSEANTLVLKSIFDGKFDFGNTEILDTILNNENFLNDIFE